MIRRDGLFCSGYFVVCCNCCVFGCDSHSFYFYFFENVGRVFCRRHSKCDSQSFFTANNKQHTLYFNANARPSPYRSTTSTASFQFRRTHAKPPEKKPKDTTLLLFCSFILTFFNKQKKHRTFLVRGTGTFAVTHCFFVIFVEANEFLRWCDSDGVGNFNVQVGGVCYFVRAHRNSLLFRLCFGGVRANSAFSYFVEQNIANAHTRPSNETHENPHQIHGAWRTFSSQTIRSILFIRCLRKMRRVHEISHEMITTRFSCLIYLRLTPVCIGNQINRMLHICRHSSVRAKFRRTNKRRSF